ncbi:MAG: molybdopterin-dependent oxidoreductase [Gemmatimonadota bacterium]
MVRLVIDGEEAEVPEGTPVILAALGQGVFIPHLCYHPALSAPASCRLCVARVEVGGQSQLTTTCNRAVQEGMVVETRGREVREARAAALEFILARHPLECPVCERSGECELQDYARQYGRDRGRGGPPRYLPERQELGSRLALDHGRCIRCTRCVRFVQEIGGVASLAVLGRGASTRIGLAGPESLDHPLSGNLLDLCPAGALVDPGEEPGPPPWHLRGIDTVCPGCASGCAARADVGEGRLRRLKPRYCAGQPPWLCDEGRFGWQHVHHPDRLEEPGLRGQGGLDPAPWPEALGRASAIMAAARGGSAAVVTEGWSTVEEVYLVAHLARQWRAAICLRPRLAPEGEQVFADGFSIAADRSPNSRGTAEVCQLVGVEMISPDVMWAAIGGGRLRRLFWLGGDPARVLGPRELTGLGRLDALVVQDILPSALTEVAEVVLPGAAFAEKAGHFVDRHGRAASLPAAVSPPARAQHDWQILSELAAAGGWAPEELPPSPEAALGRLCALPRPGGGTPLLQGLQPDPPTATRAAGSDAYGGGWSALLQRRGFLRVGGRR